MIDIQYTFRIDFENDSKGFFFLSTLTPKYFYLTQSDL